MKLGAVLQPVVLGYDFYVVDFVRAQSPPENYRAQLIVIDYCKQSLRHALLLIVASITTHQMATRLKWNVFHFDA